MRMSDPMMAGINDRCRPRISNVSRSNSEQTFYPADSTANSAADYRTNGTCGLVPHEGAMLDTVRNALRLGSQRD
jgi:hypothetical protein